MDTRKVISGGRDITREELREMIETGLKEQGRDQDYIDGYIAAHERAGWLRATCPAWMRNSAAVHYCLPHVATKKANREKTGGSTPRPPVAFGSETHPDA
jgi:hypothetical protein